jgi:8-oxo-dGTP pyrophosphatase MutT (NUDIX family)
MIASLRDRLPGRRRRVLERPQRAAVLVPVIDDGGALRLLLTRRTDDLPTHAGEVAFPGGLMEPGEVDPVKTALREAEEEIGLPGDAVEVLGLLDDFPTRTDAVAVTPVVGVLRRLPVLRARAAEVARIFDIPVAELVRADRWTWRDKTRGGRSLRIYYFLHQGETLWGLSALIVLHLLEVSDLGSPVPLRLPEAP